MEPRCQGGIGCGRPCWSRVPQYLCPLRSSSIGTSDPVAGDLIQHYVTSRHAMRVRRRSQGGRSVARARHATAAFTDLLRPVDTESVVTERRQAVSCLKRSAHEPAPYVSGNEADPPCNPRARRSVHTVDTLRGGVTRRITLELMKLKPARRNRTNCDSWDQRHVTTASA